MKVKIGPYKNWIGPYQIAEILCFWVKKQKDESGFSKKPDWVYNFGSWLAHGSVEKETDKAKDFESLMNVSKNLKHTKLYKLCEWIESKRKRKIYVKIDKWDTWSMDETLSYIILPMLIQLKKTKHGSPCVDDEDVPDEIKSTSAPPKENEWDIDGNHFKRWDWVLDEMIFAFEHKINDDWQSKYFDSSYKMVNVEEYEKKLLRIQNGFRLFGKYYQSLWD